MEEVNQLSSAAFIEKFGNVVEHTSLCAAAVFSQRPFASFDRLYGAFCSFIDSLPDNGKEGILRVHPDLAQRLDSLTEESQNEQRQSGVASLIASEVVLMRECNRRYWQKFGFTFVVCARMNKKDAILRAIQTRLENSKAHELKTGIEEVKKIMLLRLKDLVHPEKSSL